MTKYTEWSLPSRPPPLRSVVIPAPCGLVADPSGLRRCETGATSVREQFSRLRRHLMVATNGSWWRQIYLVALPAICMGLFACNNAGTLSPPAIQASGSNVSHSFNLASNMPDHL